MLALAGKLAGPARRSPAVSWVSGVRLGHNSSSTSPARAQELANAEGGGERPAAAAGTPKPAVELTTAAVQSQSGGAASRLPQGAAFSSPSSATHFNVPGGSSSERNSQRSGDYASPPASSSHSPSPAFATAASSKQPPVLSQEQLDPSRQRKDDVDRAAVVAAQASARPADDTSLALSASDAWDLVLQYEYPSPTFQASSLKAQAVQASMKAELILGDTSRSASTAVTTPDTSSTDLVKRATMAAETVARAQKRLIKAAREDRVKAASLSKSAAMARQAKAASQDTSVKLSSLPISFSVMKTPGVPALVVTVPAEQAAEPVARAEKRSIRAEKRSIEAARKEAIKAARKEAAKAAREELIKAASLRKKVAMARKAKVASQGTSVKLSSQPISFPVVQTPGGPAAVIKVPAEVAKKPLNPVVFPRSLPGSALSSATIAQRGLAARRVVAPSLRSRTAPQSYGSKARAPHLEVNVLGASLTEGWTEMWSTTIDGKEARDKLKLVAPDSKRPPVAQLAHSLDRALFNPGVHLMRDTRSNVYNFDERLRILPHPDEIDLKRFPAYVTASKDQDLAQLAAATKSRFFGSTSTLTSALAHIWFLIGGWRPVDLSGLTTAWLDKTDRFSHGITQPAAVFLRYDADRDTYGVDNDKTYDPPGQQRILSDLGKVMEKLLTTTVEDLDRFRKSAPPDAVSHEERHAREAYNYTQGGSMLMRSQLDGYDERLPGSGIFDIKTRATASIRFDIENYEEGQHYMMEDLHGLDASFERERYDMMRSAWLKYGLQCRIGGMDGIFCAYHSTRYVQGFEYFPLEAMDRVLYGSKAVGEQSFGISVGILERIFELATETFPKQTLSIVMQTPEQSNGEMVVVVQPLRDDLPEAEIPTVELRVKTTSFLGSHQVRGPLPDVPDDVAWTVRTTILRCPDEGVAMARAQLKALRTSQEALTLEGKSLPTGKTEPEMQALYRQRWEAEVADPDGEFASFAYRRATLAEAREAAAAASGKDVADVDVTYPLPMVKASPPEMRFTPPGKVQKNLRVLSRLAKAREEALMATFAGKPVQHFQQQATPLAPAVPAP